MLMKKNIKIILILLLCVVAITIVFTACADNKNDYRNPGSTLNDNSSNEVEFTVDPDVSNIKDNNEQSISSGVENVAEDTSASIESTASDSGIAAQPATTTQNKKPNAGINKASYYCNVLITCGTIHDNLDKFDQSKLEVLPENGVIYQAEGVEFNEGDSAFDVLLQATKDKRIHMEFTETPIYKSAYIEGINNIYEFDAGALSGWMYKVNGKFPNYGSSRYKLKDGDDVEWIYTCNLGADIGGDWNAQNSDK